MKFNCKKLTRQALKCWRRYKIEIVCAGAVMLVGICGLFIVNGFNKAIKVTTLERDNYSLQYDETWKLASENSESATLRHGDSQVVMQLQRLEDEERFQTIGDLIGTITLNLQKQNNAYALSAERAGKLTKWEYDGYKLLFEGDGEQVMVAVYKKGDWLAFVRFEASDAEFDILLDSVNSIVYSLNVKDEDFNLSYAMKIETADAEYKQSDEVDQKISGSKTYETADNNYLVKFALPENFERATFDSTLGQFRWEPKDWCEFRVVTSVRNANLYEYLDKEESGNVYSQYKSYYDDEDYQNFQESLSKMADKEGYIYRNSYEMDSLGETRRYENVEMLYALDGNHFFGLEVQARGLPVTEKLLSALKMESAENYSSYVKVEKDGAFLVAQLKTEFLDDITTVDLRVPEKYTEVDEGSNIFSDRHYTLGYDERLDLPEYKLDYQLSTSSEEDALKILNARTSTTYGPAQELKFVKEITIGDKKFRMYQGSETRVSGVMFTNVSRYKYYVNRTVLIYPIADKGCLSIEISGNGKEVGNELINELANFTVTKE